MGVFGCWGWTGPSLVPRLRMAVPEYEARLGPVSCWKKLRGSVSVDGGPHSLSNGGLCGTLD